MKIIFLDIDGVLNVCYPKRDEYGRHFHPHLVENLKYIIDNTGADIVISSTWKSKGLETLREMWLERNLPGKIVGLTPYANEVADDNNIQYYDEIFRGDEIQHWIDRNDVDNYVILDDDIDMLPSQMDNFVRCSNNKQHEDSIDIGYGLTKICSKKAIEILNKKD